MRTVTERLRLGEIKILKCKEFTCFTCKKVGTECTRFSYNGCRDEAVWCPPCDAARLDRVSQQFDALLDPHRGKK